MTDNPVLKPIIEFDLRLLPAFLPSHPRGRWLLVAGSYRLLPREAFPVQQGLVVRFPPVRRSRPTPHQIPASQTLPNFHLSTF